MSSQQAFYEAMEAIPLVAILRGISPDEVLAVTDALYLAGWRIIEIPLNSPDPLLSIRRIADHFDTRMLIGAGTVLHTTDVAAAAEAGARLIVSPNQSSAVIRATKALGLVSIPGVQTPTECFSALDAGADGLKLFPAEAIPASVVTALRAVLPRPTRLLMVGGISPSNMHSYRAAGCDGFGIGGSLYKPGVTAEEVHARAKHFVQLMTE